MSGWGNNWNGGYGGGGGGFGGFNGGYGPGMGWGGGGGHYGYNGGYNRPRFGQGGGANQPVKPMTLPGVKEWLSGQQPFVLQTVMKHCKELLTKKHDVPVEDVPFEDAPVEDTSDWYSGGDGKTAPATKPIKSGTLIAGGVEEETSAKNLRRNLTPQVGWTKSDMRHPHKVTTQMKPLPQLEIIPPFSAENKEADVDREKRKMLTNNVSMMQMEVTKICNRFKIPLASLDKDNLEQYPEAAREKLSLALNCVKNAEQTLTDFLDFLKTEKYKEWNDEQKAKRESLLKSMIGETPQGKPHVAAVKEDDIELVNDARIKFDDAGNFAVKQKRVLEEKSLDELEAEKNGSGAKIPKNDDE